MWKTLRTFLLRQLKIDGKRVAVWAIVLVFLGVVGNLLVDHWTPRPFEFVFSQRPPVRAVPTNRVKDLPREVIKSNLSIPKLAPKTLKKIEAQYKIDLAGYVVVNEFKTLCGTALVTVNPLSGALEMTELPRRDRWVGLGGPISWKLGVGWGSRGEYLKIGVYKEFARVGPVTFEAGGSLRLYRQGGGQEGEVEVNATYRR